MKSVAVFVAVLASLYANVADAVDGVDVSSAVMPSTWSCLKQHSYTFAIIRCYRSTGSPDPNCPHTIYNAWAGGMNYVDAYFFPDFRKGNPAGQVRDMGVNVVNIEGSSCFARAVSYLKKFNVSNGAGPNNYGMLWFDIEGTQYWGSQSANNAFIKGLLEEARNLHLHVGMYTSASQWGPITGGATYASGYPLWYAHYDGSRSFGDFRPFGGWSKPNIKQFRGDASVCGAGIDENWYP